jgi:hypothetical protein
MAIKMRLVQRFVLSRKREFMDLERQFATLEKSGALPRGQRMIPIAGCQPGNTFIWEGHFESIQKAEEALRLFETNPAHVTLFAQQSPLIEDTWVEFYEVLELVTSVREEPDSPRQ